MRAPLETFPRETGSGIHKDVFEITYRSDPWHTPEIDAGDTVRT
jgi:hypothetical protein